jgi:hypothetical protein
MPELALAADAGTLEHKVISLTGQAGVMDDTKVCAVQWLAKLQAAKPGVWQSLRGNADALLLKSQGFTWTQSGALKQRTLTRLQARRPARRW